MDSGYSETLHHKCLNITFWNDSNAIAFLDNDLVSGRATWEQIETQTRPTKLKTFAPKAAATYRRNYGEIDRSNQAGSYYKIDRKTVRKQNRVMFDAIETYALVNQHTICINCTNLTEDKGKHELSTREFRFDVVRVWFAKCRSATVTISIHYPFKSSSAHTRSHCHHPLSKEGHSQIRVKIDPEKTKGQLRCRECSSHTRLSYVTNVVILDAPFPFAGDQLAAIAGKFSTTDVFSIYPVAVKAWDRVAVKGTVKPRRCISKFILVGNDLKRFGK